MDKKGGRRGQFSLADRLTRAGERRTPVPLFLPSPPDRLATPAARAPRVGPLLNPSHALELQREYAAGREEAGLNPTRLQVRKLKQLAAALAEVTGEVVH